jgi:hypothetical protein
VLATVQSSAFLILGLLALGLSVFSLIDCIRRPAVAFPAIGRQSKVLWLVLTGLAVLVSLIGSRLLLLTVAALVVSLVYIFDVRPKIKEITGQ